MKMSVEAPWQRAWLALGVVIGFSCSSGSGVKEGAEGNHCFPNGTCNAGLSCYSNVCVRIPADGGGASGTGGASANGGTAGTGGIASGGTEGIAGGGPGGTVNAGGTSDGGAQIRDASTGGTSADASRDGGPRDASADGGDGSAAPACAAPIDRCADPSAFANAVAAPSLLYPYANTLFARGLPAPTLQWSGSSVDAVMVEMKSKSFSYRECFGPQTNPDIKIAQDAWDTQASCSGGETDPVTVTLTTVSGTQVSSTSTTIFFAYGPLHVGVYYDTYQTTLASSAAGAIMKISPGAQSPTVLLAVNGVFPTGPCVSCHSVSSTSSVLLADNQTYPGGPFLSESFDLATGTPVLSYNTLPESGFGAIHPSRMVFLTSGPANSSTGFGVLFPLGANQPVALIGPSTSRLFDLTTGNNVTPASWTVSHANMAMFSPDGKHLVYNDQNQNSAHSLWVVDFDIATKTFSNYRQIFNDSTRYPGWPSFTPDSRQIVFVLGTSSTFSSQTPNPSTFSPYSSVARSHLMIVDVATGQLSAVPLGVAGGYNGSTSYLPNNDNDLDFYPTIGPVAAGGYFWVFFTSRRTYGNLATASPYTMTTNPTTGEVTGGYATDPNSKKIWAAAIGIGKAAGVDPSHPAFYLEGQELKTANTRPTPALNICQSDTSPCSAGLDCCSGFCVNGACSTSTGCSRVDEKCVQTSDCCAPASGPSVQCIAGYCAQVAQ